jgi:mono/diheme cytochrome c family protein
MENTTERTTTGSGGALRRGVVAALGLAAVAAGAWYFGRPGPVSAEPSAKPEPQTVSRIERGRYLVTIGGCNDCHTPFKMTPTGPRPDMDRMLSGHPEQMKLPPAPKASVPWVWSGAATNTAFAGPWGLTFAANLTPDKNTGLGIWDERMFIQTLRTGKHWGQGRPIQPPMPWQGYGKMTDEDLKSVFAYLRSIPAVHNYVPDYEAPETE